MAIEKIGLSLSETTNSVYDYEKRSVLEMVGAVSGKVDECVEVVNGVGQTAIQSQAIVDEMKTAQDQFIIDNNDTRTQVLNSEKAYEGLILSAYTKYVADTNTTKTAFEASINTTVSAFNRQSQTALSVLQTAIDSKLLTADNDLASHKATMNADLEAFKNSTNTALASFQTDLNTSKTTFINEANAVKTQFEADAQTTLNNATTNITNAVNTKLNTMATDGTLNGIINTEIMGQVNTNIANLQTDVNALRPLTQTEFNNINTMIEQGKTIYLKGDYTATQPILVKTNTKIVGLGKTIIFFNENVDGLVFEQACANALISNIRLRGYIHNKNYGIRFNDNNGGEGNIIDGVYITAFQYGIYARDALWGNNFKNMIIDDCDYGIYIEYLTGGGIINNSFENIYFVNIISKMSLINF
jgi:hypothetical protein